MKRLISRVLAPPSPQKRGSPSGGTPPAGIFTIEAYSDTGGMEVGTGFVTSSHSDILITARHVVRYASGIRVFGTPLWGTALKFYGDDYDYDVACVRLSQPVTAQLRLGQLEGAADLVIQGPVQGDSVVTSGQRDSSGELIWLEKAGVRGLSGAPVLRVASLEVVGVYYGYDDNRGRCFPANHDALNMCIRYLGGKPAGTTAGVNP